MVDKPVLGRVVLRLESTEQRLLSAEDLHRTGRVLREVEQATSMADQSRADKLSDERSQIRCDCAHTVAEVFCELSAVGGDGDDLVAGAIDVCQV